jgi:hypothetical protein
MIWHIFKKDWKLLWPFVVGVAMLWWLTAYIFFWIGFSFQASPMLTMLGRFAYVPFMASIFLVVAIAQLDQIPGARQDWLIRPIKRRDLLLEKLLFATVSVVSPIFAANLFQGLADGFPLRSILSSSVWGAVFAFAVLVLPFLALGIVTQSMTEAFVWAAGCACAIGLLVTASSFFNGYAHGTLVTVGYSGIGWIGLVTQLLIEMAGVALILWLQYFRRRTAMSRFLALSFIFVMLTAQFLPWKLAFAFEQRFSSQPGAAANISLRFDSSRGKFVLPSGSASRLQYEPYTALPETDVYLPLRITSVGDDEALLSDWIDVRARNARGNVLFHTSGNGLKVYGDDPDPSRTYQQLRVPVSLVSAPQTEALQAEYSLTLFRLTKAYSVPAVNGSEHLPGAGWCRTQIRGRSAVRLECMQATKAPMCMTLFLENARSGARNSMASSCSPNYGLSRTALPDAIQTYGLSIPFRDPSGLAKYPVDGSQLAESRVVIRLYEPVDHFTRTLTIPNIRLGDWEAQ